MKFYFYSMRDHKVGFMSPTLDINDATAYRNFAKAVSAPDGIIGFAPQDFDLFCIGEFDSETGYITAYDTIRLVCDAASIARKDDV